MSQEMPTWQFREEGLTQQTRCKASRAWVGPSPKGVLTAILVAATLPSSPDMHEGDGRRKQQRQEMVFHDRQ